ncbi:MAG TPA: hypothetical protein VHK91_03525 [Flavisolibacter sp.]|jgi:hypothetical protein|nr:hypothetical protein [Flavisolibacter sp.]
MAAVLTADIVNSTHLTKAQEKKLMDTITHWLASGKYEFYRGDSFQVYLKDASVALRVLLGCRLAARRLVGEASAAYFDVRAGIGIGAVQQPVRTLRTATGEAFVLSGRSFDELAGGRRLLTIQTPDPLANQGLNVISYFIDYLFQQMTPKQAAVIYELIAGLNQREAAKKLRKTQSTINKHVQASGWEELVRLLAAYEQLSSVIKSS